MKQNSGRKHQKTEEEILAELRIISIKDVVELSQN